MAKRKAGESPAPSQPAEYTVVARRYRPQQFSDLVGQEAIARTLTNAIESDRVAHAYLFTGTRGVGKTTTARILAKALNCVKGPTVTPCDECESCKAIAVGQDVDVVEIDGASNNRIDDIRDLRNNVQFRPSRSRYKIYIIDEVHQVTTAAFNALLKTLEEPPPHIKFIFATTDVQKVPITILSRCQRFDFLGIAGDRIIDCLRHIVKAEKRPVDDEALRLLARRAAGSMRDAQSLLDQLLAFAPDKVTAEHVYQMLGTAADEHVAELADAILARDVVRALAFIDEGTKNGLQPGELLDQLIEHWRELMLVKSAGPAAIHGDSASRDPKKLVAQAEKLSLDGILSGLDVLQTARFRLRNNPHGRVIIEMAIVRLGRMDEFISVAALQESAADAAPIASQPSAPQMVTAKNLQQDESKKKRPDASDYSQPTAPRELTAENLPTLWAEVLGQLGMLLAKELERAGLPAIFAPNNLVLTFPAAYNRQREYCSDPLRLDRVQSALQRLTGAPWRIRIETAAAANGQPAPPAEKPTVISDASRTILDRVQTVFAAKLMQMDDGFGAITATDEGNVTEPEDEV